MAPIRVALIEDHNLTRLGIRTMLNQQMAIKVIGEAENGIEGLQMLTLTQPDVAIIDIDLPGMDGVELTHKFKKAQAKQAEKPQTKVMMLTMHNNEAAVLAAFAAGADSYCMKDVDAEHLLQAVQSTHDGNNWIDPAIARIVLHYNSQIQGSQETRAKSNTIAIAVDNKHSDVLRSTPLTERELEVLQLIVAGCSNAEIAGQYYITVGTVKTHVRNILNKLCVDDRTQAAVRALRGGLVS